MLLTMSCLITVVTHSGRQSALRSVEMLTEYQMLSAKSGRFDELRLDIPSSSCDLQPDHQALVSVLSWSDMSPSSAASGHPAQTESA